MIPLPAFSSDYNHSPGSRTAAMGNAAVAIGDIWSVYHNQAGLASITSWQAGIHHENRFLLPELGLQAFALAIPAVPGTIGLSYTFFGFSQYNEGKVGLAFGRYLGERISAGVQINYLYTHVAGHYGETGSLAVEGGVTVEAIEGVFVALHIYNPKEFRINKTGEPSTFSAIRFGVAGSAGENVLVSAEAEKQTGYKTVFKAGMEVGCKAPFFLRTGIRTYPVQSTFGIGYIFGNISADMAFAHHRHLGLTPHISIIYTFR
ncbi:MAG: hypothetical protein ACLFQA_01865 [Bacteroidales bacterium]